MMNLFTDLISRFGAVGDKCEKIDSGGDFLGFPKWYEYLGGITEEKPAACSASLSGLGDIWLIVLAIVEILLRLAAIAAIVFIIYAGVRYITARGNPEKITSARVSIQDAIIGLIITIIAIALVSYFGRSVS